MQLTDEEQFLLDALLFDVSMLTAGEVELKLTDLCKKNKWALDSSSFRNTRMEDTLVLRVWTITAGDVSVLLEYHYSKLFLGKWKSEVEIFGEKANKSTLEYTVTDDVVGLVGQANKHPKKEATLGILRIVVKELLNNFRLDA